ncbi:hypothetical protein [Pseudomonas sp. A-RE-19]|uniref:hypothetical protein n=1 Tax=Pseudomonas sp. A-RE-19 TaxID=2832401 RepID=UPI001CBEBFB8|nr:hypothetical protein [Pseudomonas sp. A-RE-19]
MAEQVDVRMSSKYEGLLRELGYEITGVHDDLIYFGHDEGFIYILSFDEKTPKYLSVGFGISGPYADIDLKTKYDAIQYVNGNIKFVKVYMEENSAQFSCEQIIYDVSYLGDFIETSIDSMYIAYKELSKKLREEE